ncbi:MAG: Sec-independent protein translocase protein TatB [Steroidobacteraceae bacterium]
MFDVGFQELALIFGVSLVVLGPKRMSGLATKVGRWVGKARTMAREFRQQLENEVNLDELNKMTETRSREASGSTMPPPPESTPAYPYSAAETPPTDDTYSHAHAGDAPMPYDPEPAGDSTTDARDADIPVQADLDLSTPDDPHRPPDDPHLLEDPHLPPDDTHLPPDDARRYS